MQRSSREAKSSPSIKYTIRSMSAFETKADIRPPLFDHLVSEEQPSVGSMLPGYRYLLCEAQYWPFSEWRQNDNTR
jgi:hypothetical protein